jgi:hypothetical protein
LILIFEGVLLLVFRAVLKRPKCNLKLRRSECWFHLILAAMLMLAPIVLLLLGYWYTRTVAAPRRKYQAEERMRAAAREAARVLGAATVSTLSGDVYKLVNWGDVPNLYEALTLQHPAVGNPNTFLLQLKEPMCQQSVTALQPTVAAVPAAATNPTDASCGSRREGNGPSNGARGVVVEPLLKSTGRCQMIMAGVIDKVELVLVYRQDPEQLPTLMVPNERDRLLP